jgi:hypothetical protein
MLDDRFDDQWRDAIRNYNVPPETPRDEMWAAIQAKRLENAAGEKAEKAERAERKDAERAGQEPRVLPLRSFRRLTYRPVRLAAGIAALLALGIGLGRLTAPPTEVPVQPTITTAPAPQRTSDLAYRLATTEHLSQSETFLTLFRASMSRGGNEQMASATARQLLATNRLLLDSRAASDSRTRLLLQDLELVLAQIAQLSGRPSAPDLDLITEGLEDSGVMSRLRTAVPSGTSATQGVL